MSSFFEESIVFDAISQFGSTCAILQLRPNQSPKIFWVFFFFLLSIFLYQFQLAIQFCYGLFRKSVLSLVLLTVEDYIKRQNESLVSFTDIYCILRTTMPRINWLSLNGISFSSVGFPYRSPRAFFFISFRFSFQLDCGHIFGFSLHSHQLYTRTHVHTF